MFAPWLDMKGFLMKWAASDKDVKASAACHLGHKVEKQHKWNKQLKILNAVKLFPETKMTKAVPF